ncbi:MAG TPA: protein translocase subunit SecF [Nocardioides sp.]|uniref:protein translocase subunit SecF n=1 Tax=Nocardioides sp. TaxID=35761 RepID=UPI002ED8B408
MGKFNRLGNELYTGHKSIDFVGKRAFWYAVSGAIVLVALLVVVLRGLNFGVEFTGGVQYQLNGLESSQVTQGTADDLREAVADTGIENAADPQVNTSGGAGMLIVVEELTEEESARVIEAIRSVVDVTDEQISPSEIGASWGQEVAQRAITGVVVFLVLVMLFIGFYFREWKMSIAALAALVHDIVITIGVYSLSGFPVTPAAVTGLLAILGFSLYDTVVVFDKVRENTAAMKQTRQTYAQAANLAVNQTLVRSINTGIVALIPIGAILYVSAVQLGASSLKDLALSQFVGMAAGVFSSVWVAPRILVHLKSNESEVVLAERRAKARAKAMADPYASVPVFTEAAPGSDVGVDYGDLEIGDEDEDPDHDDQGTPVSRGPARGSGAAAAYGKGRIAPQAKGPVRDSGAAGRQQPSRQPRSRRGKS